MISKVNELDWATIDWDLFTIQKEWLASCRNECAEGILSLMDYIEDHYKPAPINNSIKSNDSNSNNDSGHYLWLTSNSEQP